MLILHQSVLFSPTQPPVPILLLPAPPKRLALPAPKIAGYLPVPKNAAGAYMEMPLQQTHQTVSIVPVKQEIAAKPAKRVVVAEIANPLDLIDIRRDPDAWWAEFERIHGKIKTIEELDAEIEAEHPGYLAWAARVRQSQQAKAEAAS